jgi:large subunit ribosomal protein L4
MATLPVHDLTGTQTGEREIPPALWGDEVNARLLHQVVTAGLAARRQGNANTKRRSEVAGSGRKLRRQKGTGRARVGDARPPHFVGGGSATGPRTRSYRQRAAKGLKEEGLRSALGVKAAAGEIMLVEPFELTEAKTRALEGVLAALGGARGALLLLAQPNEVIVRCGRNLPGLRVTDAGQVSAHDLMAARRVIIITDALALLEARVS